MTNVRITSFFFVSTLLLIFATACDSSANEAQSARRVAAVPPGVEAFTSGTIGRTETVFVQLAEPPTGSAEDLLTITPSTAGETAVRGNTLTFTPANGWAPGGKYTVRVDLPSGGDFLFYFDVPERRAEVIAEGLYFSGQDAAPTVRGRVITNDQTTAAEIESLLSASQDGRALDVAVAAVPGGTAFTFTVRGPTRGPQPPPVLITYRGDAAGFRDLNGELSVDVPADEDFRLTAASVGDDGRITLRFTEPLLAKQDLEGQLTLSTAETGEAIGYTSAVEGNLLHLFAAENSSGDITVTVRDGVQNAAGIALGLETRYGVSVGRSRPALRAVSDGAILPHRGKRLFPFEAVGVSAVHLEVVRIFKDNVTQFLQDSELAEARNDWQIGRTGRLIARERIELSSLSGAVNTSRWSRYALDVGKYIEGNSSAIYQLRLGFTMKDAVTGCGVTPADFALQPFSFTDKREFELGFPNNDSRLADYYGIYGNYADQNWRDRDNPCKPAYYNRDQFITQNILSSNLGLIAKRNPDRRTLVFATDLLTASPRRGVTVRAYDRQRQLLFTGTTDDDGRVEMTTERAPEVIMAESANDAAYLDVFDQPGLPLDRFATDGAAGAGGIKGAFYAERGVWRPGDSVFLHFVLEDRDGRLPGDYPVNFTLRDARGRVVERRTVRPAFGQGLYPLVFRTKPGDVTGAWRATVEAGGRSFSRALLVETIKPNRLSIDLELPAGGLRPSANRVELQSKWLYGAPAANLKARADLSVYPRDPDFGRWNGYVFQDPARKIENSALGELFDGRLDKSGIAQLTIQPRGEALPGPVVLGVATKVFEPGGNFSIDNQRIPYDPYAVYAGLRIPEDDWGSKRIDRESGGTVALATVGPDGRPVSGRNLTVGLYKVRWSYWWQDNYDNVARYSGSRHTAAVKTYRTQTGRDGTANVKIAAPTWGRYLLRVCDDGGHCTGDYFYAGYNQEENDREAASLLRPVADRESVAVGDPVTVRLPTSAGGNLLVSLETGAGTQVQKWVLAQSGETAITFTADASMVPTVYANITLLQPYEQTTNDRPVRLYGVVPIEVKNPETLLAPTLEASDSWTPKESVTVAVGEANGKPMTYTLAVVDEGLLGLTRFVTPDLHAAFFAKEALGVTTYDVYRYVIGSLNGDFGKVLAVGGDGAGAGKDSQTANRFEPVVRHLGPFRLAGGKTGRHTIELPNYVGAVRVMVIANGDRAYGSTDKRIPVKQPLMLLPTLPRVLGPGERVDMPVNVFAMDERVRDVSVEVTESEGLVDVPVARQPVTFTAPGNQLVYFPLTVGDRAGVTHFTVAGSGNGENASQEVEIDVRHPNREVTRTATVSIAPGESRAIAYENFGVPGSRSASLELSNLPAMNLQRHLRYLLQYPYGCVEQTISPAFAQLYLDRAVELTPEQDRERRHNVVAGLNALRKFQTGNGAVAYWTGDRDAHPWATSYALHFLVEAERAGYGIPQDLKRALLLVQAKAAGQWRVSDRIFYRNDRQQRVDQAYRLYGLALAGRANIGAMNRLRHKAADLPATARFQLAAAYHLAGQQTTAADLIAQAPTTVEQYREMGYTFGSDVRDMAIILESQLAIGDRSAATKQAFRLAKRIGNRNGLSTQEAAFALAAIGKLGARPDDRISADYTSPTGARTAVGGTTGIYHVELPVDGNEPTATVRNTGRVPLFVSTVVTGKPRAGAETAETDNLGLSVRYTAMDGSALDVGNLPSGTEFRAVYTVTNPGSLGIDYRRLALRSLVPAGWEITNSRLDAGGSDAGEAFNYQDIRDDGIYTFFHLDRGQRKTFTFRLTATYPGRYYLPAQIGEAMYTDEVSATVRGRWVEVGR